MINVKRTWNLKEDLGPVVRKVDNAIHPINLYLVDDAIGFPNTYLMDSDLSRRR